MMIIYQMHNFVLQVLVHDGCIQNAQFQATGVST